jgi:hypothetical protein
MPHTLCKMLCMCSLWLTCRSFGTNHRPKHISLPSSILFISIARPQPSPSCTTTRLLHDHTLTCLFFSEFPDPSPLTITKPPFYLETTTPPVPF